MGFWSKLGKIGLTAAPYVAAPFTGGASLAFTGAANKAVGAWNERDARKNAEKGIGPSKFDQYIGLAGDVAGMASGAGALGKFGAGKYSGDSGGSWQDKLGGMLGGGTGINSPYILSATSGGYGGGSGGGSDTDYIRDAVSGVNKSGQQGGSWIDKLGGAKGIGAIAGGVGGAYALKKIMDSRKDNEPEASYDYTRGGAPTFGGGRFARNMRRQLGPVMGQSDQNFPNLAESIGSGRMDAMRDQPFRGGYDVRTTTGYDEEDNPEYEYTPMPRIGPNYRQPRRDRYYGGGARQ